jgi:hypothetical protein
VLDMIRASTDFCTDGHDNGLPSPPYSPEPTGLEYTFPTPSFPETVSPRSSNDDPLWSSTDSFLYESSLVNVSLGRRVWVGKLPVYGFNGLVQGAVKLSRKCNHVVRVEVSVEKPLIFN